MPRDYQQASPAQYQRLPEYTCDEAWTREFLRRALIGHVAHLSGDQPFVTPTNFWFDETQNRIVFHSNITGRQRSNLENSPKVAFVTSEFGRFLPANTALEFSTQYRSVMVYGTVKILETADEKQAALYGLLSKYFPKMTPGREYRPITENELARTSVYAIEIQSWSGKENWQERAEQLPDWPPLPDEFLNA